MQFSLKQEKIQPPRHLAHIAQKNIFSFSKCFEKMVFPEKSHWNMIFLVLSGRMTSLFPENILFLRWKTNDDLSQKNTWKYIFFKCSEKMFFSKKIAPDYDLFCNIWKGGISFFPKVRYFFFRRKMEDDLSENIHGNMLFSVYICINVTNMILPSWQKSKDNLLPKGEKVLLKGVISGITEKDDIHTRKHGIYHIQPY